MSGYASEWLVEIDAYDGSSVVTLRYSGSGYMTGPYDDPPNAEYDARISSISEFSSNMFTSGRTTGPATVEPGELVLANADGGLDHLKQYAFDGRQFRILRLDSPYAPFSSAVVVMTGTMDGIDTGNGMITIRLPFYDRRRDIDVPIQEEKYSGTTTEPGPTAEGSPDLLDRVKPLCFGRCYSVPALIVNDFNLFLQFSASSLSSIQLYDGGVPLIDDGDVATIELLASSTGNPGHYKTCLALGLAKPFGTFNGRPAFTWTADVVEGMTAADRTASSIVRRMLARIGVNEIDAASFAALAAEADSELGIYIDSETTVLSTAYDVIRSVGGYIMPDNMGRFTVGRLNAPSSPVRTIIDQEILTSSANETPAFTPNPDTDGAVPANSVLLKWRRHWHVHTDSDLGHCANFADPTRGTALKQEWRDVSVDVAGVKTAHLLSEEIEFETSFAFESDAQAEAARKAVLYGVNRDVVRIGYDLRDADDLLINRTVTLMLDRFEYASGKDMVIIGRAVDRANEKVILTLWG